MDKNTLGHDQNSVGGGKDLQALAPSRKARLARSLVCLNFKVPLQIRQKFKLVAARKNITMTDLLLRLIDDCLESDAVVDEKTSRGVKK